MSKRKPIHGGISMKTCCLCDVGVDHGTLFPIGDAKVICKECMDVVMASYHEFLESRSKEEPCECET